MSARLVELCRYPLKGFAPQRLPRAELAAGQGMAHDRRFAVIHGRSAADPAAPAWQAKTNYVVLVRDEAIARLRLAYDPATATLSLADGTRAGESRATGRPDDWGRLEAWLAGWLASVEVKVPGPFQIVEAPGQLWDVPDAYLSIISAATCRALGELVGTGISPLRFRGNLVVDGLPALAERDWIGRRVRLGGAELEIVRPIVRCAAINVDPETGTRAGNLPAELLRRWGANEFGLYARVVAPGTVAVGDALLPA